MSDLTALKAPFPASDIEWRIGRAGKNTKGVWATCLAYLTNRAIMDRLDAVVGPANWRNEYRDAPGGGILCGLSIRCGDEWVTKWDGAEHTDMEAVKGGLSGAMKRAGVQWGIGRYLYKLEEGFADVTSERGPGSRYARLPKDKGGDVFYWTPPSLPRWALPATDPDAAASLRALVKDADAELRADVDRKIAEGMEIAEARKLYKDIEATLKKKAA